MKLIRLYSNNSNVFRNDIQGDFLIKKDSQIALLNLNFEKTLNTLIVAPDTKLYFAFYDNPTLAQIRTTDELIEDIYTQNNTSQLISDIILKLNNKLSIFTDRKAIGTRWEIDTSTPNDRLIIKTRQSRTQNLFITGSSNNISKVDNTLIKNSGTDGAVDAYITSPQNELKFFTPGKGCGIFRIKLGSKGDNDAGKLFIALANDTIEDINDDFTSDKWNFGIEIDNETVYYRENDGGGRRLYTYLAQPLVWGVDLLQIAVTGGSVQGGIYQNGAYNQVFFNYYRSDLNLYPSIVLQTLNSTIIYDQMSYTPDIISEASGTPSLYFEGLSATNQPVQDYGDSDWYFQFPSLTFSNYLGFNKQIYTLKNSALFYALGENSIDYFDKAAAYIVELMNLNVQSFDGLLEQRKDILMLIQNSREANQADVLYDANTPVFLDLDNNYEFILRNLDIAIKKTNYENVDISGEANIAILIKEKGE